MIRATALPEMQDAATRSRWQGSRTYWSCQIAGWTLMFILNQIGAVTMMPFSWRQLFMNAGMSAFGIGATHVVRATSRARGWEQLPILRLLLRVVLAVAACVVATLLVFISVDTALDGLFRLPATEIPGLRWSAGLLIVTAANMAAVYLAWCAIYYGIHSIRRQQRAETERWKLQAALSAAELAALKAQLNPHFLFNALNSLRALVVENPPHAQEMVTRLASILRYSLQASERETVSLGEELKIVDDYLDLEAVRFEKRLRVTRAIAPGLSDVAVPPMIVQTLVENAIKHGISQARDGGEIELRVRADGTVLLVEVSNAGRLAAARDGTGTGLRNAEQRLRRLWPEAASLELRQEEPGRITARLRIPR